MSNVIIEIDSSVAVKFCKEGAHTHRCLVEEARRIVGKTESIISHTFHQANQAADCLARLGPQQED